MLIELTALSIEGKKQGPCFIDPATIYYIGYGGGDADETLVKGKDIFLFVKESTVEVKAKVDAAKAAAGAPVAEEE